MWLNIEMVQAHPIASPVKYVSHTETSQLACGARPVQDGYKCTCHDMLPTSPASTV